MVGRPPSSPLRAALLAVWLLALGWAPSRAVAGSVTARLESESVAAGDNAVLDLVFTDCGHVDPPELPPIPNCDTQYGGASSQFNFINGVQSSSVVFRYVIRPKTEGSVNIPAMQITVNGERLTTEPLVLRVGKGFDQSLLGRLEVIVPRTNLWVGETFPVEVRFYFRQAPAKEEPPTLKLDGFVKGRQTTEAGAPQKIDGQTYSVARWTMAVTAVKTGDLTLGPAELPTIYIFNTRRRRSALDDGIFNDPFFGQFFGGGEQRQINFQSPPVVVHVRTPPAEGRPAGYAGNVGRFNVKVEASTNQVMAGDPITLRTKVSGRGDFDQLRLPDFPPGAGVSAYPRTSAFEPSDALGLQGVKSFEQVVTPESPDLKSLQFPIISWWNPDTGRYETSQPPAIPITVRANPTSAAAQRALAAAAANAPGNAPGAAPAAPAPAAGPDLGRPKNDLGALITVGPAWVDQPWFAAALAAPPLAALAILLAARLKARPRDNRAELRQKAEAAAAAALARLRQAAAAGKSDEFFEALNEALQRRLAITLDGVAGSFTEDVIDGRLRGAGLDAETAASLHGLFGVLAAARFSKSSTPGELAAQLAAAESVLTALQRL